MSRNTKLVRYFLNHNFQKILRNIPCFGYSLAKPTQISLMVTRSCNKDCKYCEISRKKDDDLSCDQISGIIRSLSDWIGPFQMTFTGGEPLLRKDMCEIVEVCSKKGVITNLITNGSLLNYEVIRNLASAGLDLLTVSVNSFNHRLNRPDCHAFINSDKLKTKIATMIYYDNLSDIIPIIEYSQKNNLVGVEFQPIQSPFGAPTDIKWYTKSKYWPKYYDVAKVIHLIIKMKQEGFPILNSESNLKLISEYFKNPLKRLNSGRCTLGTSSLMIDAQGNLSLCKYKSPIVEGKIDVLWESLRNTRQQIRDCNEPCSLLSCHYSVGFFDEVIKGIGYLTRKQCD